jgi:dethiobiotin synthetase
VTADTPGRGLFVAGTGTGVGKTVVTAGITNWLRGEGIDAKAIKPAQTGAPEDDDAGVVAELCGDPDAATCLRSFGPALAPRVATAQTGETLSYDRLRADCTAAVDSAHVPIVEGIGGLRVPLAGRHEVIDLIEDLGLPTLVVARSGLGTLNHTALSVEALRNRGVPVVGVVLNEYEGATLAERTNPGELERMLDVPIDTLGTVDCTETATVTEAVRRALPQSIRTLLLGDQH